jgi:zinc protease
VAFEPALDGDAVRLERGVLASDARRVRDDMFRYPLQAVLRQALPRDAYGLPPLGDPDRIVGLEPARVRDWAEALAHRRPVVIAVGDDAPERLAVAAAAVVAHAADRSPTSPAAAPEWAAARGQEVRRKEQTALAMAFPASPFGSPDLYPLSVIGALLSGLAGRLFDALRERRALAYTVAAMPWLALRTGVMFTYIATSPAREDEARDAMLAELARLVSEPPGADELERARNYAAGTLQLRQQSGAAIAGEMLEGWVQGAIEEVAEAPQRLRAVTVDEIVRVAERVFRPDRRAEYVVRGAADRRIEGSADGRVEG